MAPTAALKRLPPPPPFSYPVFLTLLYMLAMSSCCLRLKTEGNTLGSKLLRTALTSRWPARSSLQPRVCAGLEES